MKKSREMKIESVCNLSYWISNFWLKVNIDERDKCWEWKSLRSKGGYGILQIRYGTDNKRISLNSSRMAYLLFYRYIPENIFVCHHCDNTLCCNPSHLFLGTHADNMKDMKGKNRGCIGDKNGMIKHPECVLKGENHYSKIKPELILKGESHGHSKLKEYEVRQIYKMFFDEHILQKDIAITFNVSKYAISDITRGKTWKYLYEEYFK